MSLHISRYLLSIAAHIMNVSYSGHQDHLHVLNDSTLLYETELKQRGFFSWGRLRFGAVRWWERWGGDRTWDRRRWWRRRGRDAGGSDELTDTGIETDGDQQERRRPLRTLLAEGLLATIMKNRPKLCQLSGEKQLWKEGRGASVLVIRKSPELAITKWFDKKPVLMVSTVRWKDPEAICTRWSNKEKVQVQVRGPAVIRA